MVWGGMQEPLHRCIMVQHFEEYFLIHSSVGGHGSRVQCQSISNTNYTSSHVSVRKTCSLSVGTFKDQNRWFLPPKLYTFMFGHQPSVEANTRPRIVCMSWWSNVSTVTSWIGIAPGTFAARHLLSPVSPATLHCQLANKVKMTWKIIFRKKKSIHCVWTHSHTLKYILSNW